MTCSYVSSSFINFLKNTSLTEKVLLIDYHVWDTNFGEFVGIGDHELEYSMTQKFSTVLVGNEKQKPKSQIFMKVLLFI